MGTNYYARALVEHPMWAWHIGMVAERGARVYDIGKGFAGYEVPDINHPATKGWLLHMLLGVAEAVHFETDPNGSAEVYVKWSIDGEAQRRWFRGDEALAAALLAVWGDA